MKIESTLLCRLFDYLFELFDPIGSFTYIGIFLCFFDRAS